MHFLELQPEDFAIQELDREVLITFIRKYAPGLPIDYAISNLPLSPDSLSNITTIMLAIIAFCQKAGCWRSFTIQELIGESTCTFTSTLAFKNLVIAWREMAGAMWRNGLLHRYDDDEQLQPTQAFINIIQRVQRCHDNTEKKQ